MLFRSAPVTEAPAAEAAPAQPEVADAPAPVAEAAPAEPEVAEAGPAEAPEAPAAEA